MLAVALVTDWDFESSSSARIEPELLLRFAAFTSSHYTHLSSELKGVESEWQIFIRE